MTDAPEAQETADEVARAVERVRRLVDRCGANVTPGDLTGHVTARAMDLVWLLSRLAVLEEERRLDGDGWIALHHGYQVNHTSKWCRDIARARLQARKDHA